MCNLKQKLNEWSKYYNDNSPMTPGIICPKVIVLTEISFFFVISWKRKYTAI